MFKRYHHPRKKPPKILGIFRMLISLIMILLLSLGIYKLSLKTEFSSELSNSVYKAYSSFAASSTNKLSEQFLQGASTLLSFNLTDFLPKIKRMETKNTSTISNQPQPKSVPAIAKFSPKLEFKFAIVTDSHNDNIDLKKALDQAKNLGAEFVIGLGDWTDIGTLDELRDIKTTFDRVNLPYHLIPGDHDLWDSRQKNLNPVYNFNSVFGTNYSAFEEHNIGFLLTDNADNYHGIDLAQKKFIEQNLKAFKAAGVREKFVFASTPFYHPTSDHFMGKVEPSLKVQAMEYIELFRKEGVNEIFAGDTHAYSDYVEPKTKMKMATVGAITATRNLALPRFVMVEVYADGSYNVLDIEIQ